MALSGSSGGGAGGMDFVALGSQIHEDSLESMNYFQQLEKDRRERERQKMLDAEAKRQFNVGAAQTNRAQNLNAMDFLAAQRAGSQLAANRRPNTFRNALTSRPMANRTGVV